MRLFQDLVKSISKDNPANAIALIKLWKANAKANDSITKKLFEEKRNNMSIIHSKVNEIIVACNSVFKLIDSRTQDILSLIEYIGDVRDSLDQMNKLLQEKEKKIAECDNFKNKIKDFLPNFDIY
mmetsp:Transcript_41491/g.47856  ORF Transcript_41491/g.47856 Transcript_41491/m.47856 type:complete len:125 (+) Transcript_41491:526-900(+)